MGQTIPVYMMPVSEPISVEHLCTFVDALSLLPDHNEWRKSPEKYGLRTSASRNWWHQSALDEIAKNLGIQGLDFLLSEHFVCLRTEQLNDVAAALDKLIHAIAHGIPNLGANESYDIELLRLPNNADAFAQAVPSFDVKGDDSAGSFYTFIKSFKQTVDEARAQKKCMLYMRPLP